MISVGSPSMPPPTGVIQVSGQSRNARMIQYDFSGRTAVVTGGARGIGLGIAQRLAGAGASVAVWT